MTVVNNCERRQTDRAFLKFQRLYTVDSRSPAHSFTCCPLSISAPLPSPLAARNSATKPVFVPGRAGTAAIILRAIVPGGDKAVATAQAAFTFSIYCRLTHERRGNVVDVYLVPVWLNLTSNLYSKIT